MDPRRPYAINRPDVAFEVFDDEAVLINFRTGSYYSAGGAGREILRQLAEADVSPAAAAEALASRYRAEPGALGAAVEAFFADLEREGLASPRGDAIEDAGPERVPPSSVGRVEGFDPPVLLAFTDMQALLLLDPIHEVDERGWPHAKPGTSG